jgi:hypothetical protein
MSLPGRHRTSLLLLLVLAVGFLAAGASAAVGAQAPAMACCPPGMEASAGGCAWLGAGDCCPERPAAPAPSNAAPPATAAALLTLALPAPATIPTALPACASHAQRTPRSAVLRL